MGQLHFVFSVIVDLVEFFGGFALLLGTLLVLYVFNVFVKTVHSENSSFPFYNLASKFVVEHLLLLIALFFTRKRVLKFQPGHFFVRNFHIESVVDVSSLKHVLL